MNDAEIDAVPRGKPLYGGALVMAAADRVEPGCVHFGTCGGCQYQHAAYPAQLTIKQQILTDLMADGLEAAVPDIAVHAGPEWGYRNRIRVRLARGNDSLRAGYSLRASNEFLPIIMCPIAAPVLWRAVEAILTLAEAPVAGRLLGGVSEVELFSTQEETRLQATFYVGDAGVARQESGSFAGMCEQLRGIVPELVGAGLVLDPELGRRERRAWKPQAWGAPGLTLKVSGHIYWVSRGAFFQVNRFQVADLVELATQDRLGQVAWDLYAGVGLFSAALAERFERVVAVEGGHAAAADLAQNGKPAKGRPGFITVHAPTLDFLRSQQHQRERPELVVLDPPRAGLGVEGAEVLASIGPKQIVYVSCDPVTLVRDLAVLVAAGYAVEAIHLVDLFPQTFHLETVVALRRG
jgi:23S rRNA (uracil1939-C5)-methyltransferase